MKNTHNLVYVHDPMCSWCWAFRPALNELIARLPSDIGMVRLLGGLAPDNDQPMPEDMRTYLKATWQQIQQRVPGTAFNFDFWENCTPRRSTWPACRAVIAARNIERSKETAMIEAIQHAYYQEARNPSEQATLVALAEQIGLESETFFAISMSQKTQQTLTDEINQANQIGVTGFPSLRFATPSGVWPIPVDYRNAQPMLDTISAAMAS